MTAEELYINDQRIELSSRSISRTLQINNFGEVKDRQANYSSTIKIPRSKNNTIAFETLGLVGTTTRLPYETVTVKYVADGIELINDGKGILKQTDRYYTLVIYDGNISMSDLLGTETLADLDFSSYNHDLTYDEFFDSWTNTTGYVYGLDGAQEVIIGQTSPSFYIHTLIDMIFTQKGYTISGAIFTDADYKSRLMTMDIGFDQTLTIDETNKYNQSNTDSHLATYVVDTQDAILVDSYTLTQDGVFKIDFNSGWIDVTLGTVFLQIRVNGIGVENITDVSNLDTPYYLQGDNTDIITVYAIAQTEEIDPTTWKYDFDENFTTDIDLIESYYEIVFEDIIGTTKQIDLVKDVMQRFNLSFRKTRNENEFEFITSEAMLDGGFVGPSLEDWTDKLSMKVSETYVSNYAQDNVFKYQYDNTGDDFADGHMMVDNVNLATEKTVVTTIFKASYQVDGVYQTFLFNSNEEPNQDSIRIFKLTTNSRAIFYKLQSSDENFIYRLGNVEDLDFSDLSYQEELDNNYITFNDMLDDYKIIVVECNLNLVDIYSLDFFSLKIFTQLGRRYYLNKVMNFKNNETTKVELIQIPL